MNVVDEFYPDDSISFDLWKLKLYPEKILKIYYNNQIDKLINKYHYMWQREYTDDEYNTVKGIDYDGDFVQQNDDYNPVVGKAIRIADTRLRAERRYKHLLKAKKAIKGLLDSLNRQQQRELKFYFEYPDELEDKCIELAKDFKTGRDDYKQIKKLVRKCCNELDRKLLN